MQPATSCMPTRAAPTLLSGVGWSRLQFKLAMAEHDLNTCSSTRMSGCDLFAKEQTTAAGAKHTSSTSSRLNSSSLPRRRSLASFFVSLVGLPIAGGDRACVSGASAAASVTGVMIIVGLFPPPPLSLSFAEASFALRCVDIYFESAGMSSSRTLSVFSL